MPPGQEPCLRARRTEAGFSQDGLARATGLSRQAIGAIEAGRHRPGVDAALALAGALGCTVEALFATPAPGAASVSVVGDPLPDGTPVLCGRVGDRRVHAPASLAAWQERWPVADGRWSGAGTIDRFDAGAPDAGFVVVGCDPALALAAAGLPASGPRRLVVVNASTKAAVAALTSGRAHAALVHGRRGTLPAAPPRTRRLHVARWRVGVATADTACPTLTTMAGRGDLVQREAGASSQQALLRALEAAGAPAPAAGPVAGGHLAVTSRVLNGARAGVTMEPAAVHHRLTFLPLEEHDVQLWIGAEHRDHPAVDALGAVLVSRTFSARLAAIGGYDLTGCGTSLEAPA